MNLKLAVVSQAKCDSPELFLSGSSYSVGRRQDNDLIIEEYCVSGCHAELNLNDDGDYEVTDLDSSNGTFLNRKRISKPTKIKAGDYLKFGIIKVAVEEHQGVIPSTKNQPSFNGKPLRIVPLKDRFAEAKKEEERAAPASKKRTNRRSSKKKAASRAKTSSKGKSSKNGSEVAKIIRFDEGDPIQSSSLSAEGQLEALTASRNAAEEEARRLREELSRAREKPSKIQSDNEKRLSFHITELESSLNSERLLLDDVRVKNTQFRSKIQFLTTDLDNAREEISRLKATNARQLSSPEGVDGDALDLDGLREELAVSYEDNADLQAEISDLKNELADHERESSEREESEARNAAETISKLRDQISELNKEIFEFESQRDSCEEGEADLAQSNEELQSKLATAEEAVQKAVERQVTLRDKNTELVAKVKKAERKASELSVQFEEATSAAAASEELIEDLNQRLHESNSSASANQEFAAELDAAKEKRIAAETELVELTEKLSSFEAEAQDLRERFQESEGRCAELDSQLTSQTESITERDQTIDGLREELEEATQNLDRNESAWIKKREKEKDALESELRSVLEENDQLKEDLEDSRLNLSASKDNSEKKHNRQHQEHQKKLTELEVELAESIQVRDDLESERNQLKARVEEGKRQIAEFEESSRSQQAQIDQAEEIKERLESELQLTKEGLSSALFFTNQRLADSGKILKTENRRRKSLRNQLMKAEDALEDLRDEFEALKSGKEEKVVLDREGEELNRLSEFIREDRTEEQAAFEARLEALCPSQSQSSEKRDFNEADFYRQLVEKLDLIDDLMDQHENKWRYAKIVKKLALLKHSFVELLKDHSVDLIDLEPGTPLVMNQTERIDLVPHEDGTKPKLKPFGKSEVVETVCPGYIYHNGSGDIVIRKAKVLVD